ncbi:MAG: glucose-1-phosphate adenylyltransferase [Candidatus Omnitrophica bacterium]|nr:glucose-1-phosphate adenylyltransferase [Candidatus Omnitrophota bacterium]
MRRIKALILGGGQGKRLFPLTRDRCKPAVPIAGKYRLVDIPISNCINSHIRNIFVLTQFNSASLNRHIHNTYRFDYFTGTFVEILAAEQTLQNRDWFQGTADAVRKNLNHLNLKNDEDILILSGDQLYKMDYQELIDFHQEKNADLTVSVIPVDSEQVKELGILKLNKDLRIVSFKEKPSLPEVLKDLSISQELKEKFGLKQNNAYLASMGVYLFKADCLQKALELTEDIDFGKEVIPHSIERFRAFGFIFQGHWRDIGTIRAFYEENIALTEDKPKFDFFSEESRVFTHPRFLPPAKIENAQIKNSLITEGCIIEASEIEHSVIGLRSIIRRGVRIKEAIIMGADFYEPETRGEIPLGIGEDTVIDKAIIDKNARIGRKVAIQNIKGIKEFDGDNYYIRDGIVIVPRYGVIPDETRI